MRRTSAMIGKIGPFLRDLGEVGDLLWEKGWAERNAGNISVNLGILATARKSVRRTQAGRIDPPCPKLGGMAFLVTAAGSRMRDLSRHPRGNAGLIRVEEDGGGYRILWGGTRERLFTPTSELQTHLALHEFLIEKRRPERAVLHTHPDELIALTHACEIGGEEELNRILWGMLPEVKIFVPEGVAFVPYEVTGSPDLARVTTRGLGSHQVVLWEKHGCLSVGKDVFEAFDAIDMLNKAARIFLLCKSAGYAPAGLSDAQLDELGRRFGNQGA